MGSILESLAKHDGARVMKSAAVAMKQVDFCRWLVVDARFHDTGVGSGDNISPHGIPLE